MNLEARFRGLHCLPIEDRHWFKAGRLGFVLRRAGIGASAMDALIATVCVTSHAALLQRDSDFARIAEHTELRLLNPEE